MSNRGGVTLKLVAIYSASRSLVTIWYLIDMALNRITPGANHFDNLLTYLSRYDSQWYRRITTGGYPNPLPTDAAGHVLPNNWAFLPGFPWLTKAIQNFIGAPWWAVAPVLATIFGGLFILVAYKIFRTKLDERASLWSVALLSFSTAAPALSLGYADSLGLLLTATALYLILKERQLVALLPIAALGLVRPGAIVFAGLFLGLAIFKREHRASAIVGTFVSGLIGVLWPLIAWATTGNFGNYFASENAWRRVWTHSDHLGVFQGWFIAFSGYVGPILGNIIVVTLIGLSVNLLMRKSVIALGLELRLYLAATFFYVFAVFFPQTSTLRVLLPAFPIFAAIGLTTSNKSKRFNYLLIAALAVSQALWVWLTYSAYPLNLDIAP